MVFFTVSSVLNPPLIERAFLELYILLLICIGGQSSNLTCDIRGSLINKKGSHNMECILTEKMIKREDVFMQISNKRLTQRAAAEQLGLSRSYTS